MSFIIWLREAAGHCFLSDSDGGGGAFLTSFVELDALQCFLCFFLGGRSVSATVHRARASSSGEEQIILHCSSLSPHPPTPLSLYLGAHCFTLLLRYCQSTGERAQVVEKRGTQSTLCVTHEVEPSKQRCAYFNAVWTHSPRKKGAAAKNTAREHEFAGVNV